MKTCFKCGTSKPYSEFYKHPAMGDGHFGKCKDCTKLDVANRIEKKKSDPDWVISEAKRCRIKSNKNWVDGKYISSTEDRRKILIRHKEKYPEKTAARNAVSNAVRDGLLHKRPCERCGSFDSEGHHDDYSRPLDVQWLCPKHHAERHVELRDIQRRERALVRQNQLQPCS